MRGETNKRVFHCDGAAIKADIDVPGAPIKPGEDSLSRVVAKDKFSSVISDLGRGELNVDLHTGVYFECGGGGSHGKWTVRMGMN